MRVLLKLLNIFLHAAHISILMFALVGWYFIATRKVHLLLMLLMAFFWLVVGRFKGFGYCPVTDVHWKVRSALDLPLADSYIKLLLDKASPRPISAAVVTQTVWILSGTLLLLSFFANILA